jgi:LysM repeat protein
MKSFASHRVFLWIVTNAACAGVALMLNSCGLGGAGGMADTGYGPFDSRGNYVEDWADTPEKWSRRSSYASQNAVADLEPELAMSSPAQAPPSNLSPIASAPSRQVEVARLNRTSTKPKTSATTTTRKPTAKPKVATASRPKPTPVKPNATRVVIKRGDTLSSLAARHRSSVRAIQRANGMRDTKLVAGKTLLIPRL